MTEEEAEARSLARLRKQSKTAENRAIYFGAEK